MEKHEKAPTPQPKRPDNTCPWTDDLGYNPDTGLLAVRVFDGDGELRVVEEWTEFELKTL